MPRKKLTIPPPAVIESDHVNRWLPDRRVWSHAQHVAWCEARIAADEARGSNTEYWKAQLAQYLNSIRR